MDNFTLFMLILSVGSIFQYYYVVFKLNGFTRNEAYFSISVDIIVIIVSILMLLFTDLFIAWIIIFVLSSIVFFDTLFRYILKLKKD